MKRGLVISGGGSKGAFGGGILEYLINDKNVKYDYYYGTSTGSLLISLAALENITNLKRGYTEIESSDIFSHNPFTRNGKINILNLVFSLLFNKNSIGNMSNLKNTFKKLFDKNDFDILNALKKKIRICVSEYNTGQTSFFTNRKGLYETFCDAVCSVPGVTPPVKINNKYYMDGGVMESLALQYAIDEGCEEIDIIIHHTNKLNKISKLNNIFDVARRTISMMMNEISKNDKQIGLLKAKDKDVKINIYQLPTKLTDNALLFNKNKMLEWWDFGYRFAKSKSKVKTKIIKK
jgi:NTE family protein